MPRLKLDLPSKFHFSTEIPLRISDINYNNHLGNDTVLSLIHEARVRFWNSRGYTELDIEGTGTIMSDVAIIYKSEAFYGDVLRIDIAITDLQRVGFDFVYLVTNAKTSKEVARAKTGIVFFDYNERKVVNIPEKFRTLFASA